MTEHSPEINELATALAKYQASAINPYNSAKNPYFRSNYAPLDKILAEVRPALAAQGLSITQLVNGQDTIGVTTILMHSSGQYISSTIMMTPEERKGGSQAQNAGAIITYLRRYALTSILGIAGDDDTDANMPPESVRQPAKQPSTPEPTESPQRAWLKQYAKCIKDIGFAKADAKADFMAFLSHVTSADIQDVDDIPEDRFGLLNNIFSDCNVTKAKVEEWRSNRDSTDEERAVDAL